MTITRISITFLLLSVFAILGCNSVFKKLDQKAINRHILTYEKLAENRETLDAELEKSEALSIYTCKACQPVLDSIAREAGYSNFESFLIMDLRIMYTMRYVAYLKITEIVGETAKDVPEDDLCEQSDGQEHLSEEEKAQMEKYCRQMAIFLKYIQKLSSVLQGVTKHLLKVNDLEIVRKNYDGLLNAMSNPNLIDELNRSGGGFDD